MKIIFLLVFSLLVSNCRMRMAETKVSEFGAIGNGVADDTQALQAAIDSHQPILLEADKTYRISSSLILLSNTKIGAEEKATILLGSRDGEFSNQQQGPSDIMGKNAVGFIGRDISDVVLRGFAINKEVRDGTYLKALLFINSSNIVIENLSMTGYSGRNGIITLINVRDSMVRENRIYNCTTNKINPPDRNKPQLTGIEIDDQDLIDALKVKASTNITVEKNTIEDLLVGKDFFQAHGYETDGINIGSPFSSKHIIRNNIIRNVGEGIDLFGENNLIESNQIYNTVFYGIKLIHGARDNRVHKNTIEKSGIAAVTLAGSNWSKNPYHTQQNIVEQNVILSPGQSDLANSFGRSNYFNTKSVFQLLGGLGSKVPTQNLIRANEIKDLKGIQYIFNCYKAPNNNLSPLSKDNIHSRLDGC